MLFRYKIFGDDYIAFDKYQIKCMILILIYTHIINIFSGDEYILCAIVSYLNIFGFFYVRE